ncbi:hypothetical protein CEXT_515641 [Caerostris extrusa]|uniref:Uncharacterized protein n=1 Tax=Caerostris extrusa TaxID=172846 RepID=A0AAV4NY71_CAEEX|nr:hypothetical protein CEXT_515641 [Caerostris extrusa]
MKNLFNVISRPTRDAAVKSVANFKNVEDPLVVFVDHHQWNLNLQKRVEEIIETEIEHYLLKSFDPNHPNLVLGYEYKQDPSMHDKKNGERNMTISKSSYLDKQPGDLIVSECSLELELSLNWDSSTVYRLMQCVCGLDPPTPNFPNRGRPRRVFLVRKVIEIFSTTVKSRNVLVIFQERSTLNGIRELVH